MQPMFTRSLIRIFLPAALLAVQLVEPDTVFAAQNGKAFGDWKVYCKVKKSTNRELCHIFQILRKKSDRKQIMRVELGYLKPNSSPRLIVILPLGIALPPGISIQVDGNQSNRFEIETCTREGCRASVEVDHILLNEMRMGSKMKIKFSTLNRKKFIVPVSLKGFSTGNASLK